MANNKDASVRKTNSKIGATENDSATMKKKRKIVAWLWGIFLTPVTILALMLILTALGAFGRMPTFEELENPKSNLATKIYADNGKVEIGSFFVQNRSHKQYSDLFPKDSAELITIKGNQMPAVAAALIATEDARYFDHSGIDLVSLARVGVKTIAMRHSSQGGGSTISQQLAKNLFPRDRSSRGKIAKYSKLLVSKLKEWITAIKLESNFTKEEIIALYLNTVEYGSNSFGIEAASETFFGKDVTKLNIQEAAMLVGVVNAPTRYSPVLNPKSALTRRNLVLQRIKEAGGISQKECDSIAALPIKLSYKPVSHNAGNANYFREMLRLTMNAKRPVKKNYKTDWDYEQACKEYDNNPIVGWCHKNRKADGSPYDIYRDGLKIYTTINPAMQKYAEEAVQKQMRTVIQPAMDRQIKATGRLYRRVSKKKEDATIKHAMRQSERFYNMREEGYSDDEIYAAFDKPCRTKIFTYKGERDTLITPRDSILHHKGIMRASLVAIEPRTGHVKAYVGGTSFKYFKYDNAKQGKRQVGSTVKPFVYCFAIDQLGLSPCTQVPNNRVYINTGWGKKWSPKEAGGGGYDGALHPLRWGLMKSRNNYSTWIMKQVGQPKLVADFIHNMGVASYIKPVYPLCVGSWESNVYEMVGAYCTFVNDGIYNTPIFVTRIEDRHGNIISSFTPSSHDAISKEVAYTMITMMRNVITKGTGSRLVRAYGMGGVDIAGKTGTTNKNRDAWFICVTPNVAIGSWVGAEDQTVSLTRGGEGSVMALPIVGEFLKKTHQDPNIKVNRSDKFNPPLGYKEQKCNESSGGGGGGDGSGGGDDTGFFE